MSQCQFRLNLAGFCTVLTLNLIPLSTSSSGVSQTGSVGNLVEGLTGDRIISNSRVKVLCP